MFSTVRGSVNAIHAPSVPREDLPANTAAINSGLYGLGPRTINPKSFMLRSRSSFRTQPRGRSNSPSHKIFTLTFLRFLLSGLALNAILGAQRRLYSSRIVLVHRLAFGLAMQYTFIGS